MIAAYGFLVAERAVFPPPLAPVKWTYPSPKCRSSSALGVRPVRVERHNPWSIATLRQTIARVCSGNSRVVLFVELLFYNTVVLVVLLAMQTGETGLVLPNGVSGDSPPPSDLLT